MGVDQAGQQDPIAEVDQPDAGRHLGADALDAVSGHDDDGALDVATGSDVQEPRRPEGDPGLDGVRSSGGSGRQERQGGRSPEPE